MRLEHHLVGGYVRYISPYIIIIIRGGVPRFGNQLFVTQHAYMRRFEAKIKT